MGFGRSPMVNILASRAAGAKLALIVFILLVPLVYMGQYLMSDLRKDTEAAHAETRGAAFLNLLIPVMLDAAADRDNPANVTTLIEQGPKLAQSFDCSLELNSLFFSLSVPKPDRLTVLRLATNLARTVGQASGLVHDSNREAAELATLASDTIPTLLFEFTTLKRSSLIASLSAMVSQTDQNLVLWTTGRLLSQTKELQDLVRDASSRADDGFDYTAIRAAADHAVSDVNHLKLFANISYGHAADLELAMSKAVTGMADGWIANYTKTWAAIGDRFLGLTAARTHEIEVRTWSFGIIAGCTTIMALGLALYMFKSTLMKLDEVERANADARAARDTAETMAHELGLLNNNMVSVNIELAANMKKLTEAQHELVEKGRMEQMGQLTATIAHELRNPLGAVRTSAFMLARKIKGAGVDVETQLTRINTGITRCDNIITQLLDYSRTRTISARLEDLDLWLEKLVGDEAAKLPAAVSIECNLGLDGRPVPFDPARLERAIINLMANASEAMVGNGSDPSKFAHPNPTISIATRLDGLTVLVEITDNGPGISTENLAKITKPLFTTKSFGTGLGLPAVEQIVKQHGGEMTIRSEPGKGACFTLRWPLDSQREIAA